MATYTVTKVFVRPDASVNWAWEIDAYKGAFDDINASEVIAARTFEWEPDWPDSTRLTVVETWRSKEDFVSLVRNRGDARYATISDATVTYCTLNNITSTITEEDGTVRTN
jgi:hypothetical protein